MRILVISNLFPPRERGGYEITCAAFVREAERQGHDVLVLTSDHPPTRATGPGLELADVLRQLPWRTPGSSEAPLDRLRSRRRDGRIVERVARDFSPTLVSVWGANGLGPGVLSQAQRLGVPLVVRVGDGWFAKALRRSVSPGVKGTVKRLAGRVAPVLASFDPGAVGWCVFNSEFMKAEATALGYPSTRSTVVPSGISVSAQPLRPMTRWAGRLVFVGRLDEEKGADVAVAALAVAQAHARLRIVGAGSQREKQRLLSLARQLDISDRVDIVGHLPREEVLDHVGDADCLLFPVRWAEPWGRAPLEAMALGTCVIASGTGGSVEYLEDGANSLVRSADDSAAWARAIDQLASDDALRERLRRRGARTAAVFSEANTSPALVRAIAHRERAWAP